MAESDSDLGTSEASTPTARIICSKLYEIQYRVLKRRDRINKAKDKLELAISTLEEVVSELGTGDRRLGQHYQRLADLQKDKFDNGFGLEAELDHVKLNLERAINAKNTNLSVRLPAAFDLGMLHLQDKNSIQAHTYLNLTAPSSKAASYPTSRFASYTTICFDLGRMCGISRTEGRASSGDSTRVA
ncbi:MAG: hypothetical protein M1817_005216 [Caeruleum heppii]|nr:MAG: hypothetical protein M1817_005216 [Caeruleum heppii]